MSLESQIAALVSAANNLTSQVAGKMAGIDKAVKNAVEGIPREIERKMDREVFVDQLNGDDNNPGTSANPVKTIRKAAQETPSGAAVSITLMSDYEFYDVRDNADFLNAYVRIRSFDVNSHKKIKFNRYNNDGRERIAGFGSRRGGLFNFYNVVLELPDMPQNPGTFGYNSTVITTHGGDDMGVPLSLRMNNVEIIVPDAAINNFWFMGNQNGITLASVINLTAPKAWIDRGRFFFGGVESEGVFVGRRIVSNPGILPSV
ncbi:hypothetical protein [Vreelandella populi]|uniref:Uncharacterized protein n=1 Tax=Vreelandella populi TaxID=2498858 RepID=A0A433LC75_9GAMM|nr:hypothetical protein [Halomonas populi]RUR46209.1 hypothetical protein ELY37_09475 [Halomonas populi]